MRSCRQIIVACLSFDERISLNKKVTLIFQGYKPFKFENAGFLLPLDRCWWFSANIIHDAGNAVHFVNDAVGDFAE